MGNAGSNNNDNPDDKTISPPLKQLRDGHSLKDIKCKSNMEMLIKDHGIPVCVTPSTKVILMERLGWTEPEISSSHANNQDGTYPEKFPYKFEENVFSNDSTTTAENIIKLDSSSEIADFLKESQTFQNDFRQFDVDVWLSGEDHAATTSGGYMGNVGSKGQTGQYTLEEALELQRRSIEAGPAHSGVTSFEDQTEYSTTNTQVDLVDEPDYIKTDGKYIYLANQNTLTIIDAYPAETAKILHKVALDIESQDLENIFLNGDKLVVLYRGSSQQLQLILDENGIDSSIAPFPTYDSNTVVSILDVSDRQSPQIISEYRVDGNYHDSRMIGDIIYLIANNRIDYNDPIIPRIITYENNASNTTIFMPDMYRFPNYEERYRFNTIAAIDISSNELVNSETFLMGNSNTIYVSEDNLYITYQKNIAPKTIEEIQREIFFDTILPLLQQDTQDEIMSVYDDFSIAPSQKEVLISDILQNSYNTLSKQDREKLFAQMQDTIKKVKFQIQMDLRQTAIHKIALDNGDLEYVAQASVPGHLLNQFSMDESIDEKFRIATTTIHVNFDGDDGISNNVYVLDENLGRVGSLEGIAPGEEIYSARFMQDKLYLVTFEQIDPFFVIDLSENTPKILGELKIPGFSNYLQAYDDSHIIGIGRDTIENKDGRVQTEGIKISMFDVTDLENPMEKDTIIIGDHDTYSDILYSHKALLLDKQKDIMSIPIMTSAESIHQVSDSVPYQDDLGWHGFFVYGFDENGFTEKGTIRHYQNHQPGPPMQPRSLYIGDVLYTVMDGSMKMNDIADVSHEINSVILANTGRIIGFVE